MVAPAARGGAITVVTLSVTTNLTTPIADADLVYSWLDSSSGLHYGLLPLGTLVSGSLGPSPITINTPSGFISGEATILGLYGSPLSPGVAMVFNPAASGSDVGSPYATVFPSSSGYPTEATLISDIETSPFSLETFFAVSSTDWVYFDLTTTSYTANVLQFSTTAPGGTITINSVTSGVPEPSTWVLIALLLPACAVLRKARRQY